MVHICIYLANYMQHYCFMYACLHNRALCTQCTHKTQTTKRTNTATTAAMVFTLFFPSFPEKKNAFYVLMQLCVHGYMIWLMVA
jgi:hypothetical protein